MRQRQGVVGFAVICAFGLLLCVGCGSKHSQEVALKYVPAEAALLSDSKPVVVSLEVVDQRPQEQRENIGIQRNTVLGSEHATVVCSVPEIEVVRNAVRAELERSGHRVVAPGQEPAAMSLRVALTQFLFDSQGTANADIELIGLICADVTASVQPQGRRPVSFTVESAYRDLVKAGWIRPMFFGLVGMLCMSGATHRSDIEKTLNGALTEFVRQLCLEPGLRRVFADAAGSSGLLSEDARTYAKQPAGASPPVTGNGPDNSRPEQGSSSLTQVQDSGWVETISMAQTTSQGVRTANILHGTRDYLLSFRPDCVIRVSEDPLMQEIAVEKLLQFLQGRQHRFIVRGYVAPEASTPTSSPNLPILEVTHLESKPIETGPR